MFWTILALALTIVMSAIIAYYGDLIGRKYGKKRLSWFGLRPKYTAILITSIAGALISTLTIAVLFLLVPPIRGIILEGETAIRRASINQHLKEQAELGLTQKQAELVRMKAQVEVERDTLSKERTELASVRNSLKGAIAERDQARLMEQQATRRLAAETARLGVLTRKNVEIAASNRTLTASNQQLAEGNVQLHDDNQELSTTNQTLRTKNTGLAVENQRLTQGNLDLQQKNAEYTRQNDEFARQNEDLVRTNTLLNKQNAGLDERRIALIKGTTDLVDYNAKLEERNTRLIESAKQILGGYNTLREAYNASRMKRVVVHKDEDLARAVVPARSSPEEVRKVVQNLLSDAGQAASTRGAAAGDQVRAVQVANRVVPAGDDGEAALPVTGDERVDEMVRKLSYRDIPNCLLAVAVANSVEDEPAAIDLVAHPNRDIYTKGQQVAVHRINAGLPVDKLFDDIVAFLRSMGQSAVQQGMIPRTDASGEPQVGSLTAAEIARLVETIREHNGYVRIRAVAASDIHAADPLALNFKVEP